MLITCQEVFRLPRSKPVPKEKPKTRWQKFMEAPFGADVWLELTQSMGGKEHEEAEAKSAGLG